jgi:hypothetical protein
MRFSELPEDLTTQEETVGPPPSWLQIPATAVSPVSYLQQSYSGLGEREEEEFEVDPIGKLRDLKFKQEMAKAIPIQASRYTEVSPLSPMFRARKPKFGFGAALKKRTPLILYILLGLAAYCLFLKKPEPIVEVKKPRKKRKKARKK